MTSIDKLKVAHAISVNLVEDTSDNDPRLAAICSVRDSLSKIITEIEFGEQPKGL